MADKVRLSLYSPERRLIENREVDSAVLPTSEGQIQVLPGHVQMAGTLETGSFSYFENGKETRGVITYGFFKVVQNEVIVLAETLELVQEIDKARAQLAQKKAEDMLKDAALDEAGFRKYQLKLQRAVIRQQEAGRTLH